MNEYRLESTVKDVTKIRGLGTEHISHYRLSTMRTPPEGVTSCDFAVTGRRTRPDVFTYYKLREQGNKLVLLTIESMPVVKVPMLDSDYADDEVISLRWTENVLSSEAIGVLSDDLSLTSFIAQMLEEVQNNEF